MIDVDETAKARRLHRVARGSQGQIEIESVWCQAKCLHFPKENVSHWYDGSDLVGIEAWGFHGHWWTMKRPPADWQPRPAGYVEKAEIIWQEWHAAQRAKS